MIKNAVEGKVTTVVMAIVTLPGIASGGRKSESHATITNKPMIESFIECVAEQEGIT